MDKLSKEKRSSLMSHVRGVDTGPEMQVRSLIHRMGYRYRLHRRDLPGTPDIVFPSKKKIIFVHGCFWHLHKRCRKARLPKSNEAYWTPKLQANAKRDKKYMNALKALGWIILIIWECELKKPTLPSKIKRFLDHPAEAIARL